jgi:hypothetical protein
MVSVRSLSAALLGALLAGVLPCAAWADGPADAATAKDLFERGRDLRSHGNCADALPLFQKAYALYPPGIGSLRNIAVCQEALGHVASARAAWLELRRTNITTADPKYAGWAEDADHELARLAPRVATLTVDLSVLDSSGAPMHPSAGDGVSVSIDGHPLAKDRIGTAIEHDPGTVVVRASGSGIVAPDEQALTLGAGENKHVGLHVTIWPAPPPPRPDVEPSTPAPELEAPSRSSSGLRTSAWIALGIGAAGLAGAAISFAVRQSALGALRSSCPDYASMPCESSNEVTVVSDVDRGKTASTALSVLGVVGIAGTLASITLFAVSPSSSGSAAIVLTPASMGAAGTF